MFELATGLFVLAGLGGLTIVGMRLAGMPRPPTVLALGHGALAATAVGLLGYQATGVGIPPYSQIALGLFILAALGGLFVFVAYHLRGQPLPIAFILGHGVIAIAGIVLLLIDLISGTRAA